MAFIDPVLILGLFVLRFTFCSGRVCEADRNTNGCSTPMGINAPFKREFTPACDKHDICYGCGNHYNWTREACDKALLHDMIQSCHRRMHSRTRRGVMNALLDIWYFFQGISKEERRCKLAAEMYYKIVRTFGASHLEKKDHIYCINTCADKHGSPFVEL
ncbi:uncharacterized protein LOC111337718 [Stylophora pistillata]|uniref:Conodipine-M alpha chain n=1 Tax=Stylophora pistillata TaxID=50429 RepID=A0A2B4RTZ1_STYPI|nr:uncharacterized protein LOC111337718 [Stylophora pistillata]PFX19817.1 Conodipine-M alpha chain [Stylophora pistillata]